MILVTNSQNNCIPSDAGIYVTHYHFRYRSSKGGIVGEASAKKLNRE